MHFSLYAYVVHKTKAPERAETLTDFSRGSHNNDASVDGQRDQTGTPCVQIFGYTKM